jgi:hypothetical protein
MPKASKAAKVAKTAAPKKAVARKGAKKAAKKAAPDNAPQVDKAAKAKSDLQIKEGPYNAIRNQRRSGLSPAQAMDRAAKGV